MTKVEENDACRYRDVERGDLASHRYTDEEVAVFLDVLMQAFAFATQDEDSGTCIVDAVVGRGAALVKAVYPEAPFPEPLQGLPDIGHAHDGQVFYGSGGSFGHRFGKPNGAALRDDDRGGAGCVRGSYDSAEIVRIFDAVEHDNQLGIRGDIFQLPVRLIGAKGDDSLMNSALGSPVKRVARLEPNRDAGESGKVHDLLKARTTSTASDQDTIQRTVRAQRFPDRMNADKYRQTLLRNRAIPAGHVLMVTLNG